MIYLPLFFFFVLTLLLALGLTRLMITLAPKIGLIDEPGERRIHTKPIPRAGGLAVWGAFMLAMCVMHIFFNPIGQLGLKWFGGFLTASLVLVITGYFDDRWGVPAKLKLCMHALSAVVLFFMTDHGTSGVFFGFELPWYAELFLWVVWTVVIINAFNLIDGMDGLCAGLAVISVGSLTVMTLATGQHADGVVLACMIGALLGFLRYNFNPARIFLGDTGSMFIGFFIASVALNSSGERFTAASLLLPLIVAGVPLIDVILAVWRRGFKSWANKLGAEGGSKIFGADQEHLHHRLLSMGLTQRKVASILYGLAVVASMIALLPYLFNDKTLGLTIGAILVSLMIGLRYLAPVELKISGEVLDLIIQRPQRTKVSRFLLTAYDGVVILAGLLFAYLVVHRGEWPDLSRANLKNTTLAPTTAMTVALGLVCLNAGKAHIRRWSRASFRDFLSLAIWYYVGTVITITVNVIISDQFFETVETHAVAFSITGILLFLPRVIGSFIRESVIDSLHRNMGQSSGARPRVLLYGAGDIGHLFLNHLKITAEKNFAEMRILGFLDDHPSLNFRYLDGFRIRGGLEALEDLSERWELHGIILTVGELPPEKLEEISTACRKLGLKLYEWMPDLKIHEMTLIEKSFDRAASK